MGKERNEKEFTQAKWGWKELSASFKFSFVGHKIYIKDLKSTFD